jgi:thiosulfate/3-mercaptopyruvate sulfurtransferase
MRATLRYSASIAVAGCLLMMQPPLMAADGITGNLVGAKWLEKNLGNPEVLILDASPGQIYKTKHIPGAVGVDLMSWYGIQEIPLVEMERLYQSWGISPGMKIVMYDQGGTFLATRLFFSLYYHAFPAADLLVLDGGLAKWQEIGLPVTKDVTAAPKHGSFRITRVNEDVRVRLPEFLTASGDRVNNALVEGLGPEWHFGEVAPFDRAGHPPNGILLPSDDFFNPDKTFKSPQEITQMATYLGIRRDQQIYSYCGGGVAASVPFFALKFMASFPNVKLYKESELGWLSDERGLPYWTYDAPLLMRETRWLRFWASERTRAFGGAQVSIIDVRPTDAYNEGHVPFAVNIPADVFRRNLREPEKLADILGRAGVDSSQEAVVVSGGGLTTDGATAFVALEKLGQKKVSVFMDTMEAWIAGGAPTKKDAVGSMRPTTSPRDVRMDVVVADSKSTQGVYPRILIASGKTVSANARDGIVVHVPYADLLNADLTPKAAKDIWNILTKAGVPRYAELVCFSDDPGEAAVNYFILKLMGYPDVKVLVTQHE